MKKHLLVTYAWSINNIGDMGIQGGLFTLLRKQAPGLPVKLINYLPERDPAYAYYKQALPPYNPDGEVLPMPFFDLIGGDPCPTPRRRRSATRRSRETPGAISAPGTARSSWTSSVRECFLPSKRKRSQVTCSTASPLRSWRI